MHKKQRLNESVVKSLSVRMDGQEICAKGEVIINDVQMKKGITSVELVLIAGEQPNVSIKYDPYRITEETANALGLKKMNYE